MSIKRRNSGFTLLEMIIIIAIIGILSAVALPKMSTSGPQQKFFKNDVMGMLRYAREMAIAKKSYIQIYFNSTASPNQFEIYICTRLTSTPNSLPAGCRAIYNFFNARGTGVSTATTFNTLTVPVSSTVVAGANSGVINFDSRGMAYNSSLLATPGIAQITYTFDSTNTINIIPSTGYIYAP